LLNIFKNLVKDSLVVMNRKQLKARKITTKAFSNSFTAKKIISDERIIPKKIRKPTIKSNRLYFINLMIFK